MHTRRTFLRTSLSGLAATWTLPAFINSTVMSLDLRAADSAVQTETGKDGTILVIVQMGGGNDGLSTVVPYADDAYYRARSQIGLKTADVIKLNEHIGLNAQLAPLKNLFDSGNLALINGVGYPNPCRSHFRSMEIWQTASDSNKNESTGWIGRYFDNACSGCDPTVGVNIGSMNPEAFYARGMKGISLANPGQYRSARAVGDDPAMMASSEDGADGTNAGASIGELGGASPMSSEGSALDFLQRTALDAQMSSSQIAQIVKKFQPLVSYPKNKLASSLQLVGQLIAGGLKTRVFYVNQGGYDTHANQRQTHDRLMGELATSLSAFCEDLKKQGNFERVTIMTFSEFGRRLKENASGGTDHGAAGPMFVLGGAVKPGLYGSYPSLTDLNDGDLKFNTDFRSVYASLLKNWLKTDPAPILKQSFPILPII